MAKIYYKQILKNIITINDVPDKWRAEVEKMLHDTLSSEEYTILTGKPY